MWSSTGRVRERRNAAATRDDQGASGRNGVEVFEADGVSVENLTACNFLNGGGEGGNEIWWNGGDGTGTQNLGAVPRRVPFGDVDVLAARSAAIAPSTASS